MTALSTRHPDAPVDIATWLYAVYSRGGTTAKQRDVLVTLAIRFVDWGSSRGVATIRALTVWCQASRSTVQRALRWALNASLLRRLQRGHRCGNGVPMASEWELILSQGVNGVAVEAGAKAS